MGKRERNLLQDVARHPFAPVTERYRRQGWTAHTGTQVQRSLREKGWLEPQRVGTPWGQVVLLELTAAGRRQLEKEGVRAPGFPKNAGLEHEYWKEQVAQHFRERGYGVEKEVALGAGQAVDVVCFGDTHHEYIGWVGGILFVNPGSPTRPNLRHGRGELGTIAILDVKQGSVSAEIRKLHRRMD